MELWIRVPSKNGLIKIDNVFIKQNNKEMYEILTKRNVTNYHLATYETKERALEVLDEIHERIAILTTMGLMGMDEVNTKVFSKYLKEKSCSVVYQMPIE